MAAANWYEKFFGGRRITEAPDRLMYGSTRLLFIQKADAKPRFEVTDRLTESRLREAKFPRGPGEALFLCHSDETPQVVQIAPLHLSAPLITPFGS